MKYLHKNPAAFVVHSFRHSLPALNLRIRKDSWRTNITFCHQRNVGCFGDNETSRRSLGIVVGNIPRLDSFIVSSAASHRRHNHSIRKFDVSNLQRVKQRSHSFPPQICTYSKNQLLMPFVPPSETDRTHATSLIVFNRFVDLVLCVHHEWTVASNWLLKGHSSN